MPDVTSAATYTKDTTGNWNGLEARDGQRSFLFAGSSVGSSLPI